MRADPDETAHERPIFILVSASKVSLPASAHGITGLVSEGGIKAIAHRDVPQIMSNNLEKCLDQAFTPLGIPDWNSIFWVMHLGGRAILDQLEEKLRLKPAKLLISRHVLLEYGNMSTVCVHFALDEMRKRSENEGKATTGEGLE